MLRIIEDLMARANCPQSFYGKVISLVIPNDGHPSQSRQNHRAATVEQKIQSTLSHDNG